MGDDTAANHKAFPKLVDVHQLLIICGVELVGQFHQPHDLFISDVQFLFVEPVVGANAACIGVHHRLHGILQLLRIEQSAVIFQEMLYLGDMCLYSFCIRCRGSVILQKFQHRFCGDLALCQCTGHVLLRASAGDIAGSKQACNGRGTLGVHPITACGMSAYNIGFCSLDFHILLRGPFTALDPFQCLRGRHIQIRFHQGVVLFRCNSLCAEVTRPSARQILADGSVNTFRGGQTVLGFIDLPQRVHLLCADTLCQRTRGSDGIFAAQCDEAHFKGSHLRTGTNAHGITCTRIERRIPHLMPGETGMIGLIESGCTACGDNHSVCLNEIHSIIVNAKSKRTLNPIVFHKKVCDIDMVFNRHLRQRFHRFCQNWLHVFAVDLQVAVATCHVLAVLVLEDDQAKLFHVRRHLVQALRHGKQQIATHNAVGILTGIVHVILRFSALCDIGVQCIDTGCQTAASLDVRLFTDQHLGIGLFRNGQCGIASGRSAADDQHIGFAAFYFHLITILPCQCRRYFSADATQLAPSATAVTTCRSSFVRTSPAAKSPDTEVTPSSPATT